MYCLRMIARPIVVVQVVLRFVQKILRLIFVVMDRRIHQVFVVLGPTIRPVFAVMMRTILVAFVVTIYILQQVPLVVGIHIVLMGRSVAPKQSRDRLWMFVSI